jgi:(2R)-sulfolactate sulfo-lyase subunit alpha
MAKHHALVHNEGDAVAVVIIDIAQGTDVSCVTLEGQAQGTVEATQDIPLGHKIALRDIAQGSDVIKYGRSIGEATQNITAGQHVHTQNVKSQRWA